MVLLLLLLLGLFNFISGFADTRSWTDEEKTQPNFLSVRLWMDLNCQAGNE